jgi:rhodanese-related sulfurtransferase
VTRTQFASIAGATLIIGAYVWWRGRGILFRPSWPRIYERIRTAFPNVLQIEPETLERRMRESRLVVIDCRDPRQFAFSHIPGAVNCRSVDDVRRVAAPGDPVVAYCVIGYRSSMLTQKLQRAGFTDVSSLKGAILRWANEDRPLENSDGQGMTKVDPWLKAWAKHLLKPGKC